MSDIPRLALAIPGSSLEPSPACLALLAGLTVATSRIQHFRTRACPLAGEWVTRATGIPGRHLDSWLMPPAVARRIFCKGARNAHLAIIEGTLDEPESFVCSRRRQSPGDLRPIATVLDAPIVAVVPCDSIGRFHLPRRPERVDAVILDGLSSTEDYEKLSRLVRLAWHTPVLGAVEALPEVRAAMEDAAGDEPPPTQAIALLAHSFLKFADTNAILQLAASRPFPAIESESPVKPGRPFRVAYAQDEAFGFYFPDTLEALEELGAELLDFSPLRDGALPSNIDLVMIGCGMPDQFARELSSNVSMTTALRSHVCQGRRIYSEGGGTAYLGRTMHLLDGEVLGAGILPIEAELQPNPAPPVPVERALTRDSWVGPRGTRVRGYLSGRWILTPTPDTLACPGSFGSLTEQDDIAFRKHAVGGMMHLHLGALDKVVASFAGRTATGSPLLRDK